MAIPLGNINALFARWFGRDATQGELDFWQEKDQKALEGAIFNDARVKRAREGFKKHRGREPNSKEMGIYLDAPPERLESDLLQGSIFEDDPGEEPRGVEKEEPPALDEKPPPVPEFEESEFFQEFLGGEEARRTQAEEEFASFYDDLILESQGDFNTAKARLEQDYQRAIGVNDLDAAQLILRLNEGLETRSSVLLDDFRSAVERSRAEETAFRTEEARQAGIAGEQRLVSQQHRGLFGSGIAGGEEQRAAASRQAGLEEFARSLEEERQLRESQFAKGFTEGRTTQQRAISDLQQSFERGTGEFLGRSGQSLQREREEAIAGEFERLQSDARQRAFDRFLSAFPSARQI